MKLPLGHPDCPAVAHERVGPSTELSVLLVVWNAELPAHGLIVTVLEEKQVLTLAKECTDGAQQGSRGAGRCITGAWLACTGAQCCRGSVGGGVHIPAGHAQTGNCRCTVHCSKGSFCGAQPGTRGLGATVWVG